MRASPFAAPAIERVENPQPPPQAAAAPAPLAKDAFHGLAGRIVRKIAPHTEADPAAMLI